MSAGLRARLVARIGSLRLDVTLDTLGGPLVLVGPNGAGKTSLLALLLGALPVEQGRIEIGPDVLLDTAGQLEVPLEHRRIGYVPQDYALFPHLTVRGNVDFALASASPRLDRGARRASVEALLRALGLEGLAERHPTALSGGEKQRAALARALSVSPRALLLDEPLGALDVYSRREVCRFLAGWLQQRDLPTVVVTHDAAGARALGGHLLVLERGLATQVGSWAELAARPATRFVE